MAATLIATACAVVEPAPAPQPAAPPVAVPAAPVMPQPTQAEVKAKAEAALAEEARALLAQAETDVQRARARRALWQKAWEALLAARQAMDARDPARAIRHARRASEFAQLGLEQLAYPAVK